MTDFLTQTLNSNAIHKTISIPRLTYTLRSSTPLEVCKTPHVRIASKTDKIRTIY